MSADATTETTDTTAATGGRRPLRVLIAADTFAPDVNGAATFTEEARARPRRPWARGAHHRAVVEPVARRVVRRGVPRRDAHRPPAGLVPVAGPRVVPLRLALDGAQAHRTDHRRAAARRGAHPVPHRRRSRRRPRSARPGDPDHRHEPLHAGEPARVHAVRQAHDAPRVEDRLGGRGQDLPSGRGDHDPDRASRRTTCATPSPGSRSWRSRAASTPPATRRRADGRRATTSSSSAGSRRRRTSTSWSGRSRCCRPRSTPASPSSATVT